jgi:excisionase family DNA binding protein
MVTTFEAADIIGVTHGRIRQLIRSGELPAYKIGEGKRATYLIKRGDLEPFKQQPKGRGRPRKGGA